MQEIELTEDDLSEIEQEELSSNIQLKNALRNAKPSDFEIRNDGEWYPYSVSFEGADIAKFLRKADAEIFVKSFAPRKE